MDMRYFGTYLKEKKNDMILMVVFACILVVTNILYNLPLNAMFYPLTLCFVIGIIYLLYGYLKMVSRLQELKSLEKTIREVGAELPEAVNVLEESYQKLILEINDELINQRSSSQIHYQQMVDYYTLWVHQIKTPIASMRLLLGQQDSDDARKLLSDLTRIEQYVEMVLTYLRLDFETNDYVLRSHDIDEMIRPIVRKFAPDFIGRKLGLSYEPINQSMITDKKWFTFCIEQILSNALKYTKEGTISIYVCKDELIIEDTGIGIAPQDLPRIFEKGYTGYNGRIETRASGIGLYLCKRICDDLHLTIQVESKLNSGTKMKIGIKQNDLNVKD